MDTVKITHYEGVSGEVSLVPLNLHDYLRGHYKRLLLSHLNGSDSSVQCGACVCECMHARVLVSP